MAMAQIGIKVSQSKAAKLLNTVAKIGTPLPNIQRLEKKLSFELC